MKNNQTQSQKCEFCQMRHARGSGESSELRFRGFCKRFYLAFGGDL